MESVKRASPKAKDVIEEALNDRKVVVEWKVSAIMRLLVCEVDSCTLGISALSALGVEF